LIISCGVLWIMTKNLLNTIHALQNTAIGNCRKRIEEAALRAKGAIGSDPKEGDAPCTCHEPQCGVTSILKRKHGL